MARFDKMQKSHVSVVASKDGNEQSLIFARHLLCHCSVQVSVCLWVFFPVGVFGLFYGFTINLFYSKVCNCMSVFTLFLPSNMKL